VVDAGEVFDLDARVDVEGQRNVVTAAFVGF
jgi:hypothetical protein